jgi:hypothetical protein
MKNTWWDSQFGFESWSSCHNLLDYDANIILELIIKSEYCQLHLASSTYIIMGRNPCFALCCKSYTVSNLITWQDEMKFVTVLPNMIFLTVTIKSYSWHFYFTGLILLFVIAWPLSFLFSFLWIFLQPFEGCFPVLSDCNGFLEKFVTCKLQIHSRCFNMCLWILTLFSFVSFFFQIIQGQETLGTQSQIASPIAPSLFKKGIREETTTLGCLKRYQGRDNYVGMETSRTVS